MATKNKSTNKKSGSGWKVLIPCLVVVIVTLVSVLAFNVSQVEEPEREKLTWDHYFVGSINEQGEYVEGNTSIYLRTPITTSGLKCMVAEKEKISYKLFFYTEGDQFLGSSTTLTAGYTCQGISSKATHARIMINPLSDADGIISPKEVHDYAVLLNVSYYKQEARPTPEKETYIVDYVGIFNGVKKEINDVFFLDYGSYPTSYTVGQNVAVDDLHGRTKRTPVPEEWEMPGAYTTSGGFFINGDINTEYEFMGWYLDPECTILFDRVLGDNERGDITLYAKYIVAMWTDLYC